MDTRVIIKQWESNDVRIVVSENGEPLWVAKDVCDVLGLSDTNMALKSLENDEKLTQALLGSGQSRKMWLITEPGLYSLILRSKKPEAKAFKRWITHEVLPTLRKTGGYECPKNYAEALRELAGFAERNAELEQDNAYLEAAVDTLNPIAQLYKDLADTEGLHDWQAAAKILSNRGHSIGRNRLIKVCRDEGILLKNEPEPYQTHIERGHFKVKILAYNDKSYSKTFVTNQGLGFLDNLLTQIKDRIPSKPEVIDMTKYLEDKIDIDKILTDF